MKRTILRCAAGLLIAAALLPTALAAEPFPAVTEVQVCYPTSVTRSEDGTEIRKVYDLSPEQDPAGIPRSDFEQDGFHYTLTDLLQQELPEHESRPHTETVSLESKSKTWTPTAGRWTTSSPTAHPPALPSSFPDTMWRIT